MVFEVGDKVWIHLRKERFPAERKSKLMPRIDGPFEITRRINNNSYQIDLQDEPDLRTNPFQEGGDDMIMEEVAGNLDQEAAGELVAEEEQLEPEEALEALTLPTGPITRSQTKMLNQDIGRVLSRLSRHDQELKHSTLVCLRAQHLG
ncbi:unnamed protein product [Microthlaspi erraticum]|uniref:Tf2-1-like SH3-like domain-containing protein n=1 Tax=Microthlaspi erraticum TaxID=1685480 RepID=A0A6D2JKS3_9BRAS|nr:unnamed protein product [Microthlaspi erraticum]